LIRILGINEKPLFFATSSPRRKQILDLLDLGFHFIEPVGNERDRTDQESIFDYVEALAFEKAKSIVGKVPANSYVFGSDTIVLFDGQVLGKPQNKLDAVRTLRNLASTRHSVITSICGYDIANNIIVKDFVETEVYMRDFDEIEIKTYVESGDAMDKAGSYAIQNELFRPVEAIKGCYFSVVGLPVCNLLKILTQLNLKSIIDVDKNQLNFEMCTKCVMLCSAGKS
tara:strand:- start:10538 stop:11218 length:681 start_codon:yes stop_codon:yes gene_type:complete